MADIGFLVRQLKNVSKYNLETCLKNSPHKDKISDFLKESHRLLGGAAVKRLSQS